MEGEPSEETGESHLEEVEGLGADAEEEHEELVELREEGEEARDELAPGDDDAP